MKTQTQVVYQISSGRGADILFEDSDWNEIVKWEQENEREHPDWRITRYQIKSITTIETIIK